MDWAANTEMVKQTATSIWNARFGALPGLGLQRPRIAATARADRHAVSTAMPVLPSRLARDAGPVAARTVPLGHHAASRRIDDERQQRRSSAPATSGPT